MKADGQRRRCDEIRKEIAALETEKTQIEISLSGGDEWGGMFAEVFGDSSIGKYGNQIVVTAGTYRRLKDHQRIECGYWASTFRGPSHCHFDDDQMPVYMRGSMRVSRWDEDRYRDKRALIRFAKRHKVSLVCKHDVLDALKWADRMHFKEKFGNFCRPTYYGILVSEFGNPSGYRDDIHAVLVEGEIISSYTILQKLLERGANARADKAERLCAKIRKLVEVQNRRRKTGRHGWAKLLELRLKKVNNRRRELCKREILSGVADQLFSTIIATGNVDMKLRKLVA